MCELVISVIDKSFPDPKIDCRLAKRGLVIAVFEDDHDYGRMELTHPMFRILKLPKVPMAFGKGFLGHEMTTTPQRAEMSDPFRMHRAFKLDIDHPDVPADLKAHLADETRQEPSFTIDLATWPLEAIAALKTLRPSMRPTIGQDDTVIG